MENQYDAKKIAWDESSCIDISELEKIFRSRGRENILTTRLLPEPLKPRYSGIYPIPLAIAEATDTTLSVPEMEQRIDAILADTEDLNQESYVKFFRSVLHLEEIEMLRMIKKYSHKRTVLRKVGKYFVYDVQNKLNNTQFLNLGKLMISFAFNTYTDRILFHFLCFLIFDII